MRSVLCFIFFTMLATSCSTTNIKPGDMPENNQAIVFGSCVFENEKYDTVILINNINRTIRDSADAQILFRKNSSVEALFLPPGEYYYTFGGVGRILFTMNDPKIKFTVQPGKINYIGTFHMKYVEKDFIFKLNYDNSDNSFNESTEDFRKRYPDLANRFQFNNAVKNLE